MRRERSGWRLGGRAGRRHFDSSGNEPTRRRQRRLISRPEIHGAVGRLPEKRVRGERKKAGRGRMAKSCFSCSVLSAFSVSVATLTLQFSSPHDQSVRCGPCSERDRPARAKRGSPFAAKRQASSPLSDKQTNNSKSLNNWKALFCQTHRQHLCGAGLQGPDVVVRRSREGIGCRKVKIYTEFAFRFSFCIKAKTEVLERNAKRVFILNVDDQTFDRGRGHPKPCLQQLRQH